MIWDLARLRFFLLIRQKIGWVSLVLGVGLILIALVTANVSYVNPQKIFWDFSLGMSFFLQVMLAIFLGTQIFNDEKYRRTLHLLLSSGLSRRDWILGNLLGLWLALVLIDWIWLGFSFVLGHLSLGVPGLSLVLQAKILQNFEILLLLSLAMLFSFWVKPLLALAAMVSLSIFLHSVDSLQRIFTDPATGHFVDNQMASVIVWGSRIFPPLQWFDIKDLVGYETEFSWTSTLGLVGVALVWALILNMASWLKFEKMDL